MNKVILLGRFTKDPEIKNSGKENIFSRFTIAVNRPYKKEGEQEADFINCVAFGKTAEIIEKYFKKGSMAMIVGHLQVSSYDDSNGNKKWSTDVVLNEIYFGGSNPSKN